MPDESDPFSNQAQQLIDGLDKYKNLITGNLGRVKKAAILWSSISLLYIYGDIHINITNINETATGGNGVMTPWGVSIIGITEYKFFVFLLIITFYYSVRFWFSVARIMIEVNPFPLFFKIYSYQRNKQSGFSGNNGSYQDFEMGRNLLDWDNTRNTPESTDNDRLNDLRQFMVRRPTFGFLETVFAPMVFPVVLSLWAVIYLVIKTFC